MKGTGIVTASWYNVRVEHTLGPTSQQHAIGHCLPLAGPHPTVSPESHYSYSTWTPYTKTTHKSSQNTARITRSSRKCNQELLPLTASNQGSIVPANTNIIISFAERVR
jgi:hypothetical protein